MTNMELVLALNKNIRLFFRDASVFIVGGAVRDELLGIENKDWDVEVFGVPAFELLETLTAFAETHNLKLNVVGKSFQVFKMGDIDISLSRRDTKTGVGHKGFDVVADPWMTTKEAASRRDFTINALMKDVQTGRILDWFNGLDDLHNGVIKMVSPTTFTEDPLRVLRALQFAGRFNFVIERNTLEAMQKVDLSELPAERIFGELEKLLLKSENPSAGLKHGLFPIPELDALWNAPQDPEWHPEGNTWIHTLMAVDVAAKEVAKTNLSKAEKLTVMLAVLCHDFGKAISTKMIDGRWRALSHASAGLAPTKAFLDRMGIFTIDGFDVRSQVLALVNTHLFPPTLRRQTEKVAVNVPGAMRRMARKVRLDLLALVSLSDLLGRATTPEHKERNRSDIAWFTLEAKKAQVLSAPPKPILMGQHLIDVFRLKPGKQFGTILAHVFNEQLSGRVQTLPEALGAATLFLEKHPEGRK